MPVIVQACGCDNLNEQQREKMTAMNFHPRSKRKKHEANDCRR
jgi:hypothetical protein